MENFISQKLFGCRIGKLGSARTAVASAHGEGEAERLIREVGKALELPTGMQELMSLRKSDERKVIRAAILRKRTAVGVNWIAERLAMGQPGLVSRMLGAMPKKRSWEKELRELEEMLGSRD